VLWERIKRQRDKSKDRISRIRPEFIRVDTTGSSKHDDLLLSLGPAVNNEALKASYLPLRVPATSSSL
jgi:hypothetical protein